MNDAVAIVIGIVAVALMAWPKYLKPLTDQLYGRAWAEFYAWRSRSWARHPDNHKAGAK